MMVELAPYLGVGTVAAVLGYQMAAVVPQPSRISMQIIFLGVMFSLVFLDKEPGWNLVLLICFGTAAGMTFSWSGSNLHQTKSWIILLILVIISVVGGVYIKTAGRMSGVLPVFILLYILGWVLLSFLSLPVLAGTIWTFSGLALFTFILMIVISQGKTLKDKMRAIPIAIQLFIVMVNLFWLATSI